MASYYVNDNAQITGEHEVHTEGRDAGQLERGVGQLRRPREGQGEQRCRTGERDRRGGHVCKGWGGGGVTN